MAYHHLELTTHEFKNNIGHYLNLLSSKAYDAIIVKRYNKRVAMIVDIALLVKNEVLCAAVIFAQISF